LIKTIGWGGEKYYNANVVSWLKQDWNSTIVRASMGIDEPGGFLSDSEGNRNRVKAVVDAAIANDIYVIIDWHSHQAEQNTATAVAFFQEMAQTYGNNPHVIYEIYNEPIGQSWATIKAYSETVIAAIRAIDPDNLIVVGTPFYSQRVDEASQNPITSSNNLVYALHFYAGTHFGELRNRAQTAINNGIAIMVTEYGTVNANGAGSVNTSNTQEWMSFLAANNITHLNWATNDKNEGSSALRPGANQNGGWSTNDLTDSGNLVRNYIQNWTQYCDGGTGGNNTSPSVSITSPSNNSSFDAGTTVTLSADASDSDGTISSVEFFANGISVGSDTVAPYSLSWSPSVGNYSIRATAIDNEGATSTSLSVSVTINSTGNGGPLAYPNGVPHVIPGTINATSYDTGGAGVSYSDTDLGNNGNGPRQEGDVDTEFRTPSGNVGWIADGEWLQYTVNVQTAGLYNISYQVASLFEGQFNLNFEGQDVTGSVNVPITTSWGDFITVTSSNISLSSGEQVIRLNVLQSPFNIADITFELVDGNSDVAVTGITVNPTNATLDVGQSTTINASVLPSNATNTSVSWSSTNTSVATVNNSGLVTAINEGDTTIIATTVDGSFTANASITVNSVNNTIAVTGVTVNPTNAILDVGQSTAINASVSPSNATNTSVSWSSTNPNVATVNNSGLVTAASEGNTIITATTVDGSFTAITTVTVNPVTTGSGCESPTLVSIPFSFEGAGTFCWEVSGNVTYINSWSAESVTINGVDYTNGYFDTITAPIDGKYYIEFVSTLAWGHFEIDGTNSRDNTSNQLGLDAESIHLYPNPSSDIMNVRIANSGTYDTISIIDIRGSVLVTEQVKNINTMQLSLNTMEAGFYFLKLSGKKGIVTKMFIKN